MKKAKKAKKTKKKVSRKIAESLYMHPATDPAHSPGHRRINLKDQSEIISSLDKTARVGRISKVLTTNRRVITGAALGKTGQLVIK